MFNQEQGTDYPVLNKKKLESLANLKLAMGGHEYPTDDLTQQGLKLAGPLLEEVEESEVNHTTAPIDARLQTFLNSYFAECGEEVPKIPDDTFILDREGLGRVLSFPPHKQEFFCETMKSYKIKQGVLHNPAKDKRTTVGVFHICQSDVPVPADKIECPKIAFLRMLKAAFYGAPDDHLIIPYTAECKEPTRSWVSLYMRPVVVPGVKGVKGFEHEKATEMHFFVPGNMVSCLDFVESVFGNAGNPRLSKNDAALDPLGWTGHSGMAILAPHLTRMTKKECGLPHISQATERQKRERMCWEKEDELYNDGKTFKMYCRDASGVICTIIADNYFGYCKKEVKTQISYSANLYGFAEEEHAGGAIARPSYDLGESCDASKYAEGYKFSEMVEKNKHSIIVKEEGYAVDKKYPEGIIYVPEDSVFTIEDASIKFNHNGKEESILLTPKVNYVLPNGYTIILHDTMTSRRWTLRGILPQYTLCHKPCTVSGGGKSEISKSIRDAVIEGSVFVNNKEEDFKAVQKVFDHDFSKRYANGEVKPIHILDPNVTLGTVVELLTPSHLFTKEHNDYISSISPLIVELVMTIKSLYREDWKGDWQSRITVDKINGNEGNELKYRGANLSSQYLRVGFERDETTWRVFQLRKDFFPAAKLQMEDDITASVIVPTKLLKTPINNMQKKACKIVKNCELRLFQRPDDAVFRGFDKQTEYDFSIPGHFISNYQPMTREEAKDFTKDVVRLYQYTEPMRKCLQDFVAGKDEAKYIVSSSYTRLVPEGDKLVGSKNPRYLQRRPDMLDPEYTYMTFKAIQLYRKISDEEPLYTPVDAVLSGRRNNPPQVAKNGMKLRPLSVFAPLHYFELPELLMECITSMTGASPSMFGAGSEGALTKGPFNSLPAVVDLNNYLLGMICCGYSGFVSSASYCGPHYKVAHDISLLIPEIWSKMIRYEQEPKYLIEHGYLEPCPDVTYNGKTYSGKRLGYRITTAFANHFLRTLFSMPNSVMPEDFLKPELQDLAIYADSYEYMSQTDKGIAMNYVKDGTVEGACPPLKALIYIMANGEYNGMTRESKEFREMFDPEVVLNSEWYKERLVTRQKLEVAKLNKDLAYLNKTIAEKPRLAETLNKQIAAVKEELQYVSSEEYLHDINGSIGTDPYPYKCMKH
ncbi:hypothetical protein CL6EHI_198620 [Entamoeba histolytica]|uniref:PPi-type phosphoenolpyruvate carboxykinase 3 n=2 Tax=Entamoeba histolytica TaxID=5759 RepID=PECK3_ENTH1|nr:hypothetical protein EHI_198620 [Entamoeba histolytica HM-1:IMSS]C4LWQ8.1 RecName: Full=PPi-type phosphoenolpyruvate carboxykinase 3; Short=EhPEPCK3; Short=PPi-PEPCK3; AltName: Full=Diphosphate-dependent phosphoenolpyruvate carboxykinase 3; AltName: Full=PEP carboxyphosphotransferase 3 [Entamoeba histolytica HM-1:IMSS]EAL49814.2 hypothetical protein EHI_198620 [Entamoeba histolytica HM-1:IMSS]GAT93148.1 hypothetical protein CL6EHI_198620 [Entamoeba histolytica]|eukprot:XP_655201.2 hypothetical protein EHI_198620 [Entamoeba histolytica HM-1:IMSS]